MKIKELPSFSVRTIILATCASVLTWLVVTRSVATYFAYGAPETALRFNPREPEALDNLAELALEVSAGTSKVHADPSIVPSEAQKNAAVGTSDADNGAAKSQSANDPFSAFNIVAQEPNVDLPAVRAWAESSFMNEPPNARALRILGQITDFTGNHASASKFMHAAASASLHDWPAIGWLMIESFEAKDYQAAIYYANVMLRIRPELSSYVLPVLGQVAEDKVAAGLLETVLVSNPPWRDLLLQGLPQYVTDERIPLNLLLALKKSSQPPTTEDVNRYLGFLVQHKMYSLAYYTWLQFLSSEQLRNVGLLYNGSFDFASGGSPFDWVITQGAGVIVDIEPRPDKNGAHALVVNFQFGRVDYHSVTQLIMLTSGRYRFTGQYKGNLIGPRGLRWRVACAESPTSPFAESQMIDGRASDWSDIELDFTVPNHDCSAQYLSLDLDARMPSEKFVTGSMWFDDLRISRLANMADR